MIEVPLQMKIAVQQVIKASRYKEYYIDEQDTNEDGQQLTCYYFRENTPKELFENIRSVVPFS